MFLPWFSRKAGAQRPAALPPGLRVYAIGDVHGRADLLRELDERIAADARGGSAREMRTVLLGDYVDRGPDSREVVERIVRGRLGGLPTTCLLGNHEAMLLRFLEDVAEARRWLTYGGRATLMSYGVPAARGDATDAALGALQREFRDRFPSEHRDFLARLPRHASFGDYFFVHAGIRPGVPIERQNDTDLIWIREEFLASSDFHGRIVVHGHSYKHEPEVMPNRIGIDTGAYATGRLTCLVLERSDLRFL